MTETQTIVFGVAFVVTVLVLGWLLRNSIRANTMNFGTAARHMERLYHQADDHLMRLAEKETCDPNVAAQLHSNERRAQSARNASTDRAEIEAASEYADSADSELLGGAGSIDE